MKKVVFIAALFILGHVQLYAQKRELGAVTIEELKEKEHPRDTSAVAAVLFEKGKTYFEYKQDEGFFVLTEVETKIKIYKKQGYEWANQQVSFYIGNTSKEVVSFSKAITYNLVNGQIEKTKSKSENEFVEQKNKYWGISKIAMPNVKEGSIIEYKYTIKSPFISSFPDWKFQKAIPVNYSEYTTNIPEYYFYNVYRKGPITPVETKDKLSKTIRFDQKILSQGFTGGIQHDIENLNYFDNSTTYKLENLPAIKDESFVNNIDNYAVAIQHEHSGTQMPGKSFESFSTTWEDVAKTIYENSDFGPQLNKNNYYEEDLKTLLAGASSNEEKISKIFDYVQSRIAWNKLSGYLCDSGVKKAYQDKTGNTADINLMLVSMLRFAQLDANPVLVSTRSNGISLFPSRTAFNSVIASVMVNNNLVLLDATSKNASPDILPLRDLNWFGRIIRKDGTSEMVDLMPKATSMDVVNMLVTVDNKGQVSGKVREQYLDYYALRFRDNFANLPKEQIIDKIEKEYKGIEVEEYELVNTDVTAPVVEKYGIKNTNAVEIIGDKMYFSPLLHFAMTENPFKQETREYPIDFSFPFKDKFMVNLTLPEGYQVESLPKNTAIAMDKKYGTFSYTISNTDTQLQLSVALDVTASIVSPDDYDTLKEFFKVVLEKENEKIVLKKI